MEMNKREYILKELMVPNFMEREGKEIVLQELEETGKSILYMKGRRV